eukprot:TRINITY_DN8718_c0_g1_i1.p2 TRINITY_DN8718_c0_g1~~TRINITY_DN8718_c0_g1_i1.p2  ORF type:complete len:173 (+),score=2.68 TRINITY_DN8718_c0_g1_i1:31-519(+)
MAGIPVKLSAQRGDTSGTPTIHRFRVDSWETLKGHIGRIFDPMDDVIVKYHDDAGDAVVLSNQEEWDECLQINTGENTNPLCLSPNWHLLVSASARGVSSCCHHRQQRNRRRVRPRGPGMTSRRRDIPGKRGMETRTRDSQAAKPRRQIFPQKKPRKQRSIG